LIPDNTLLGLQLDIYILPASECQQCSETTGTLGRGRGGGGISPLTSWICSWCCSCCMCNRVVCLATRKLFCSVRRLAVVAAIELWDTPPCASGHTAIRCTPLVKCFQARIKCAILQRPVHVIHGPLFQLHEMCHVSANQQRPPPPYLHAPSAHA